jgi:hypothetical protein
VVGSYSGAGAHKLQPPSHALIHLSAWNMSSRKFKFVSTEFYELRLLGFLRSSAKWSPQKAAKKIVINTAIE